MVKVSTLIRVTVIFLMVLNVSLLKVFGILTETTIIYEVTVACALVMTIFIFSRFGIKKDTLNLICLVMMLTLLLSFRTSMGNGKSFTNVVLYSVKNWMIILSIPVAYVLRSGKWNFKKFLKLIVNLINASYLLRAGISVINRLTGSIFFESIAREYAAENWIRNGWLRINPPSLAIIFIPISMYLLFQSERKRERNYYLFSIVLSMFYTAVIHGARSVLLYQILEILFILIMKRKGSKKQIILFMILAILSIAIMNSSIVQLFIASFGVSGEFEGSTAGRLEAVPYYLNLFLDNFWTGTGFLHYEERLFVGAVGWTVATLGDVGILWTLVQIGFGGLLFYIMFVIWGIWVGKKARRMASDTDILVWGIVFSIMITGVNIDLFYGIYAFAAPISLAIISYVDYRCKNGNFSIE